MNKRSTKKKRPAKASRATAVRNLQRGPPISIHAGKDNSLVMNQRIDVEYFSGHKT